MSWFFTKLISSFLLPPLNLLLLLGLAILLSRQHPRISRFLCICSFVLLWLFSTPYFAEGALHQLEANTRPLGNTLPVAGAIVILGGGSYFHAPEYENRDTVNGIMLARLRYGANLYRKTHKLILLTGGSPLGSSESEAMLMKTVLEQDFNVPVRWTENKSINTLENAQFSFQILQKAGIKRIFLVTHAWHMPRASELFKRAGFEVIEAPTAFTTRFTTDLLTFVPDAESLKNSSLFFHELIGLGLQRLKPAMLVLQNLYTNTMSLVI